MNTAWPHPSSTRLDAGEQFEIVERYAHPRAIDSRTEFRRWLETALRDWAARPPDHPGGSNLSRLYPQVWEFALTCAARFCTECRPERAATKPGLAQADATPVEERKEWNELLERLRAVHACMLRAEKSDADRLANYLRNFSSSGHKAMITELWAKGSASYHRLANLRGKYSVSANADRVAIDRLLAKAALLWSQDRQIRIYKETSGLALEKHAQMSSGELVAPPPLTQTGPEAAPPC